MGTYFFSKILNGGTRRAQTSARGNGPRLGGTDLGWGHRPWPLVLPHSYTTIVGTYLWLLALKQSYVNEK